MSLSKTLNGIKGKAITHSPDERRTLTRRIVASGPFERSPRLKEMLLYLTDYALQNPETELHEQQIGAAVFGKASGYDTNLDNVVRVTASQLRKRLEQYFAGEGTGETLLVEIPKGQYVPVFRERDLGRSGEPGAVLTSGESRGWSRSWTFLPLTILLACVSLVLGGYAWRLRERTRTELDSSPALRSFWSQLLRRDQPTDIVLADSVLSLYQELSNAPLNLQQYLNRDAWRKADTLKGRPDLQFAAQLASQKRYTGFADAIISSRIASLAGREQNRPLILFARDLNIRQLKNDNVVLIGSNRANPWVELFDPRLSFHFHYDQAAQQSFFENSSPHHGELLAYRNDRQGASYCLVAFLPNLNRTGNALIISGTEIEGTEAGGEFLTTESSMAALRKMLGGGDGFPYFEVLLKARKIGGSIPGSSVVCHRLREF